MSNSRLDSSDTKSSGLGLTRPSILASGADLNKPGSRRGIQGLSLTPARSITTAGISLSSGRPQREQYQSVYTNRLGGSLTNSAPNISHLSVPSDRQSKDNLGDGFTPRRANISSLRLSPRRGSADPHLVKLEQINDGSLGEKHAETPQRGSDVVGTSLQRQFILEEGGHKRNPAVNLSRTHSDIEYSQRIRRASKNLATYSPKSPNGDANGNSNGENGKLDSGYNSPKTSKFTYNGASGTTNNTLTSRAEPVLGDSEKIKSNSTDTVGDVNVKNLDSVDGGSDIVKTIEKVRYDSGYHSPRHERNTDNQNQHDRGVEPQEEKQGRPKPASIQNISENLTVVKGSRQYSNETYGTLSEIGNKVDSGGTVNSASVGCNKDFSESQTPKQRPVSRGSNLEATPENTVLKTNLNNSSKPVKQTSGASGMSASRSLQKDMSPAGLSQNPKTEEFPTPQPRTRRRLTKRISFKRVVRSTFKDDSKTPKNSIHPKKLWYLS